MTRIIAVLSAKGGVGKSLGYSEFVSLHNGDSIQIGPFIDSQIEKNKTKVKGLIARTIDGRNEIFEILEPPEDLILDTISFESGLLKKITRRPVALMRKPAPNCLLEVKTNSGSIAVTPEHKFLVMRNGILKKIRTGEIMEGKDYLLHFSSCNLSDKESDEGPEIAELLGYIIGDGYMEGYHVHVFSQAPEQIENAFLKVFGGFKKLKSKKSRSLYRISFFEKNKIKQLYEKYDVKIAKSAEKEVPAKLLTSSNENLAAFVRALFDCDAHVNIRKREIEYVSKSKKLAFQVACILRSRFGVSSQIKSVYKAATNTTNPVKKEYWKLLISSSNVKKYFYKIGFKNQMKKERLAKWVDSTVGYNTNIEVFPVGKILKGIRERNGLTITEMAQKLECTSQFVHEYECEYYALSREKLYRFIEIFDSFGVNDNDLESLRQLAASGFSFRIVTSVKPVRYQHPYVYDFQVSEEGAHFIHATGIVVSNTTTTSNIGAALAERGKSVIVMDGNVTTPNLSIHLGIPLAPVTLNDVLKGGAHVKQAIYRHNSGLRVVPASLSVGALKGLNIEKMAGALMNLIGSAEIILIDGAAGLGKEATAVMELADEMIIVTNPDMPSLTDALKAIKIADQMGTKVLGIVVNRVRGQSHETSISDVREMLEVPVIAVIPEDRAVPRSIAAKNPVVSNSPRSRASREFKRLAASIAGEVWLEPVKQKNWFDRMIDYLAG